MNKILCTIAAGLLALPFAARADSEFSVVLEGGATRYNQSLSSGTDTGVNYGVRLGMMPTQIFGFELGYLGSQNNLNETLRSGTASQTLMTNGGYGDLRLNVLPGPVTPYVFGGYGLTNVKVSNEATTGLHGKTTSTIPFGGGLEANLGAFKLGGRFQYNYMFDRLSNNSATATGVSVDKGGNADNYGVSLDLGASFH